MRGFSRFVVCAGLLCLAADTPAAADPISITSGVVLVTGPFSNGSISIAGTRGFSIEGVVETVESRVDPFHLACSPVCLPGETISVTAVFAGTIRGTATLDGEDYELSGSSIDLTGAYLEFVGTAMVPALTDSPTVVRTPFQMTEPGSGSFSFPGGTVPLSGFGLVSLALSPAPFQLGVPPGWAVKQVRYDFTAEAAPVPEPATLTLIALGLTATTMRARSRRRNR